MKIYRYKDEWYIANAFIKGRFYFASGRTHFEALKNCLEEMRFILAI